MKKETEYGRRLGVVLDSITSAQVKCPDETLPKLREVWKTVHEIYLREGTVNES